MILDVDQIIGLLKKYTRRPSNNEIDEQEAGAGSTDTGGSSAPAGKAVKKWETGLTRSHANQTANTVWTSGRKDGPTYRFDRKTPWSSGRQMGKTGGSDFA